MEKGGGRHLRAAQRWAASRLGGRQEATPDVVEPAVVGPDGAPTIAAELDDGPLAGRTIQMRTVEGRPPKTIDVDEHGGGVCRYCLAEWTQSGGSATYTFLYRV